MEAEPPPVPLILNVFFCNVILALLVAGALVTLSVQDPAAPVRPLVTRQPPWSLFAPPAPITYLPLQPVGMSFPISMF